MTDDDKKVITSKANDASVTSVDFKALLYEYSTKYDKTSKKFYTTYPIIVDKQLEGQKKMTFEEKVKARNGK
jgi:hypothetical protein